MRLFSAVSSSSSLGSSRQPLSRTALSLAAVSPLSIVFALGCGETNSGQPTTEATTSATTVTPAPTTAITPPQPPTGGATNTPPVNPPPPGATSSVTPPVPPPGSTTGPAVTPPAPPPATTTDTNTPPATSEPGGTTTEDVSGPPTTEPPVVTGVCPADPGTAPTGTMAATHIASVTQAEGDYDFHLYEGPVWIDGALYFSDVKPSPWDSNIRKYVPGMDGTTDFLAKAGSNGLAVDASGVLHSATARKKEISKYDLSNGTQSTAVSGMFNSPNDIAIAQDGTIYFSDQQQGELPAGGNPQGVHQVRDGQDAIVAQDVQPANGVLLSPADDILYISVTGNGVVKAVPIGPDGTAGTPTDFATSLQTPDGLTKDCLGNIYIAEHDGKRVTAWTPEGTKIATITLGQANNQDARPTNIAFGGTDRKTLYITATYSLWEAKLPVAGYPY